MKINVKNEDMVEHLKILEGPEPLCEKENKADTGTFCFPVTSVLAEENITGRGEECE